MIARNVLLKKYNDGKSMHDIAHEMGFSLNKVKYWMVKHRIPIRSISEAIYIKNNPDGDPFKIKPVNNKKSAFLMGLGLGLYWGEGTKADKNSIRLGNSDPELVKCFIKFLLETYGIDKKDFKFGLQLFNDSNPVEMLNFWAGCLGVNKEQFQKVVITPSRGAGTYRKKVKYGVLTTYYHNTKLRDILGDELKKLGFCG